MRETKLPKGWTWTSFKQVTAKISIPNEHKTKQKEYLEDGILPIIDQGTEIVGGFTNDTTKTVSCNLPVIVFGDHTKVVKYINFSFGAGADGIKVLLPKDCVIPKFVFYGIQLLAHKIVDKGYARHYQFLEKESFPLVPIPEQERIVTKIEELFSELDKGVEMLQKTKEQLKVYRQAVLKDAFEGRLTNKYRHSNKIIREKILRDYNDIYIRDAQFKDASGDETQFVLDIPKEWLFTRIGDIFNVEVGATPSRRIDEYWNGNINWVSSGEVKFNNIMYTKECITQLGLESSSTKLQPVGSVLLAMIGEGKTRGQAAILMIPAAHNQNTAAILVSQTPCSPQYIYYYLKLNYEYTRRIGSGNNQKALNKERVRALNIPFTSFDEQTIIACEIEKKMSICERIEQIVDEALLKAESLRQSILKKAFEGKLVTQEETING